MINKPKGTQDILPQDIAKWQYVEKTFTETARAYGFKEIRTPVFEHTELFARSAGEGSDIVNKEMYTFTDKGERSLTLKPEGTAGVARAFIEDGLHNSAMPVKLWYNIACFRQERPQAGRYRQFHQFGCELFGSALPEADFEVIAFANAFFEKLGIKNLKLFLNSIGCPSCRGKYIEALQAYYNKHIDELCGICNTRLSKNTLRILDCKEEKCIALNAKAPVITEYLCESCSAHFNKLQQLLKTAKIDFEIDPKIVRGLDYYSGTVFEFVTDSIGAKSTVCGGGRYDGLIEELGGKSMPAAGFGLGIERLILLLTNNKIDLPADDETDVFFAVMDEKTKAAAYVFLNELRRKDICAETDLLDRSLKAQLKYAAGQNAKFTVILGESELTSETATVKDMQKQTQEGVAFQELIQYLTERIEKK